MPTDRDWAVEVDRAAARSIETILRDLGNLAGSNPLESDSGLEVADPTAERLVQLLDPESTRRR
jgi:hypothetical protein